MFDTHKIRMIELPYGKEIDDILSRYHTIPKRDGRTDGQTELLQGRIQEFALGGAFPLPCPFASPKAGVRGFLPREIF